MARNITFISTLDDSRKEDCDLIEDQLSWIVQKKLQTLPPGALDLLRTEIGARPKPSGAEVNWGDKPAQHPLWRTNHRPTEMQKSVIHNRTTQITTEINDLDTKILRLQLDVNDILESYMKLQNQIIDLVDKRSRLERRRGAFEAFLSPARSLPPEVLSKIIAHAFSMSRDLYRLASVSYMWRSASLDSPSLLDYDQYGTITSRLTRMGDDHGTLSYWYKGTNIYIYPNGPERRIAPFLSLVSHIKIDTPYVTMDPTKFFYFKGGVSRPTSVSLTALSLQSDKELPLLSCPSLSELRLHLSKCSSSSSGLRPFDFPNLTSVEFASSDKSKPICEKLFTEFAHAVSSSCHSICRLSLANINCDKRKAAKSEQTTLALHSLFPNLISLERLLLYGQPSDLTVILSELGTASNKASASATSLGNLTSITIIVDNSSSTDKRVSMATSALLSHWMTNVTRREALKTVTLKSICLDSFSTLQDEYLAVLEDFADTWSKNDIRGGFTVSTAVCHERDTNMKFSDWVRLD